MIAAAEGRKQSEEGMRDLVLLVSYVYFACEVEEGDADDAGEMVGNGVERSSERSVKEPEDWRMRVCV
jgi:hypothetical protein